MPLVFASTAVVPLWRLVAVRWYGLLTSEIGNARQKQKLSSEGQSFGYFHILIACLRIAIPLFSYCCIGPLPADAATRHTPQNAISFLGTMAGTAADLVVGDQTNQESRTRTTWEAAAMALWDQLGRKRLIIAVSAVPRHK